MYGAAATRLLTDWRRGLLPDHASLVALPAWTWRPAGISMGRKDDHGRLLMPVRVRWEGDEERPESDDGHDAGQIAGQAGPILLRPASLGTSESVRLGWSVDSLGVMEHGSTLVHQSGWSDWLGAGIVERPACGEADVPRLIDAPVLDRDAQHRILCGWVEDGITARWEFLQLLDAAVEKALHRAHMTLVAEYSEQVYGDPHASTRPILHEEALEALRSRIVYGEPDSDSDDQDDSLMLRLIAQTHDLSLFDNVDPQRWLRVKVGRICRYWVRSEVGDPEAGPKIRRTAKALGLDDPEKVAAALHGIGPGRVEAALSLAPHPDAGALRFGFGESPDDDAWLERAARSV